MRLDIIAHIFFIFQGVKLFLAYVITTFRQCKNALNVFSIVSSLNLCFPFTSDKFVRVCDARQLGIET